jgi:hypothetical protein
VLVEFLFYFIFFIPFENTKTLFKDQSRAIQSISEEGISLQSALGDTFVSTDRTRIILE